MAVLKFAQVSFIGQKIHPVGVVAAQLAAGGVVGSTRTAGSIPAFAGKCHSPQTNAILPANNIRAFAYLAATQGGKSRRVRRAAC